MTYYTTYTWIRHDPVKAQYDTCVMMSLHFFHNEVKSASNFVAVSSLVVKLLKKCRVR